MRDQGAPEKAAEYYRAALAVESSHIEARFNLGVIHRILGDRQEAIGQLRRALAIVADSDYEGSIRAIKWDVYTSRTVNGRRRSDELQKVTTLSPESYEVHWELATNYLGLNEPGGGASSLRHRIGALDQNRSGPARCPRRVSVIPRRLLNAFLFEKGDGDGHAVARRRNLTIVHGT